MSNINDNDLSKGFLIANKLTDIAILFVADGKNTMSIF